MPSDKHQGEGEAERRMRELYEERLREYGELAAVEDEKGDDARYRWCSHFHLFHPPLSLSLAEISGKSLHSGGDCE